MQIQRIVKGITMGMITIWFDEPQCNNADPNYVPTDDELAEIMESEKE